MWPGTQAWQVRQFAAEKRWRLAAAEAPRNGAKRAARGPWRRPERSPYLSRFQDVESELAFLDSPYARQYGPRGFKGAGVPQRRRAASVERMSDNAREDGDGGNAHTDEAALSARLQRLSERLARDQPGRPADGAGEDRATTASGYARGFRLSSELVAGVLVGGGIGWLIDRWLGIAPWGLIAFVLLGFAAGVLNVMRSAGVVPGGPLDGGAAKKRDS